MRHVIKKFGWDVKSNVLKFRNDKVISLRIINEKHGYMHGQCNT